ncbi:MAG: 16S rRNA (uracil(1498)-N(3))-methyltransferase [Opitutales bacterium]|nr:16S rRNA (uracil(1498)-N(3))-methyltransferase [Opitutales bacterium]
MNRILFDTRETGYRLTPRDPRLKHARGVLRVRPGDVIDIGVVNGPAGRGTVTKVSRDGVDLDAEWTKLPPPPPDIRLLVGMPRPQTARKILFEATTLGVRAIHFVASRKSDPAYARSTLWSSGEWRAHLIRGAEQAFDTRIPEVTHGNALHEIVATLPADAPRLALDVYEGTAPLREARPVPPLVLAIGPERGWSAADRDTLRTAGFQLVHLGPRVLRVETAVVAALVLASPA